MPYNSLIEYLADYVGRGGEIAYVDRRDGYRSTRSTYREVAQLSARVARELEARGLRPGERVVLWGRNSEDWVAAFFGCVLFGAVVVPVDQGATDDFARRVAQQVDAKLVIASGEHLEGWPACPVLNLDSLRATVARHTPEKYSSPAMDRRTLAQIIFTSGTTAEPKGVMLSHGNILANLEPLEAAIKPYLKWERLFHPLRFVDLVPLSHVFGQFLGMWIPPLLGSTVIFQDTLNPAEIISTIKRERAAALVAVPRVLQALQRKIERDIESEGRLAAFQREFEAASTEKFLRRMWRFRGIHRRFGWKFWAVISGGATLDADTELFWGRIGFAAIQGYGLTETTSLVTVNHPFRLGRGSIGKVLAGREIKLDTSGEILVRGESIASGYWQGSVAAASDAVSEDSGPARDGWLHTGDLGEIDAQGNLYFKGRKKDVIVTSAGMNVYPEDVEAALRREPEIKDCVVIGITTGGNAEPFAVILNETPPETSSAETDGESVGRDAIASQAVARANSHLAEYQRVRQWIVWPEVDFPRTSTGKPKTAEIRAAVEARLRDAVSGELRNAKKSGGDFGSRGGIRDLIRRIGSSSAREAIGSGAALDDDLNLTSLDRVELLGAIEDRYQIDLNETRFTKAETVGQLEQLVRDAATGRSKSEDSEAQHTEFVFPRWAQRWPVTWIRTFIYYLLTWPATHLLAHPRVVGRENLRGVKGPVLVICNHVIYLDVGFVLAALPSRLRNRMAVALGGERLAQMRRPPREWFFLRRWLHRMNYFLVVALFDVFPLPKASGFRESFRFAGDLVDRGWNVLIFPEGEQTRDGKLQPFCAGIGILANQLNIPVVPMRIDGAYEVREEHSRFNRPGRIRVYIGEPAEFSGEGDPQQIANELEQRVAALGHEEGR